MKNYLKIIAISLTFPLISCEDIIDLDLKNAAPKIVIEANITDDTNEPQLVAISQTKPFDTDKAFDPISGATILLTDEKRNLTYTYQETSTAGIYRLQGKLFFTPQNNDKFRIEVTAKGSKFVAIASMPQKVKLDSLSNTSLTFFGETSKFVQVNYQDPANERNFYNCVLKVNNEKVNAYYVEEDRFNDGSKVKNTIFNDDPELKTGDVVELDFQCISPLIYRYFFSITQINGNGGPPTAPANPDTNWSNGALGYFSVHTTQKMSITVK